LSHNKIEVWPVITITLPGTRRSIEYIIGAEILPG